MTRLLAPFVLVAGIVSCTPAELTNARFAAHGVEVAVDSDGLRIELRGGPGGAVATVDLAGFGYRTARGVFNVQFGMFALSEVPEGEFVRADAMRIDEATVAHVRFTLLADGDVIGTGEVRGGGTAGHIIVSVEAADEKTNRIRVNLDCAPDEHFAGFGGQSHDVDHRGQIVPLWVSEQGIGKRDGDEITDVWQLVGRRHTTHAPIPVFVSSRGVATVIDTSAFAEADVCATDDDKVGLEVWTNVLDVRLFLGDGPLDALSKMTAHVGRPTLPAPWLHAPWNDALFGTDNVREFAEFLRAEEIPSSAIWSEDWKGGRNIGAVYRLEEDWNLDEELYPGYSALTDDLRALGLQHQLYFNTFVVESADIRTEVESAGYLIEDAAGGPFWFTGPDANFSDTSLIDMSNEDAVSWVKGRLRAALALGARGWMADYAEWLPVHDVVLASGDDPALFHNRYAVRWQEINQEVLAEEDLVDEVIIYARSGHLGSQSAVQVFWAGDQRTSFQADDGLPTIVPIGLGLAATGIPFFAHDIAGYQSATNEPSSKELFFRWTELGALSPVMRTHHGTNASENWHLAKDEETTAHWKRYAELHIRLYPYVRALAVAAVETGRPMWIPPGFLYPDDEAQWPLLDQLFFGDALLVAPVVTEGATSREVVFPPGRFAPAFSSGAAVTGPTTVSIDAPLEEIPVFVRAGGIVPMLATAPLTLLADTEVPGLETTEGDRVVIVGLGAPGSFTETTGARYVLTGSGIDAASVSEAGDDGGVVMDGNGTVAGDDFTLTLSGHPDARTTTVYFR